LLTGLGIIVAPAVVRLYSLRLSDATAAAQQQVATDLLRMFMPQMLFYGITAIATALLNAHRRFAAPAVTPVFNNLLVTAIFLALPHLVRGHLTLEGVQHDPGTLLLLGLGTTAGIAAMALPLWPAVRRAGIRLRPVFNVRHPAELRPWRSADDAGDSARRRRLRPPRPAGGGPAAPTGDAHPRRGRGHGRLRRPLRRRAPSLLPLPLRPAGVLRAPRHPDAVRP